LERAATLPADLIVMGTHGTSGFQHLMLGSVTERVLRRAVCPVLTVPPRAHATSRIPFRRLLCAIDFSESSMAAMEFAVSLAEESDARLTLLHVLEWPWEEPPSPRLEDLPPEQGAALAEYRRYREKMALMRLEALAPDSMRASHRPVARLSNGKPYVQILDVANEEGSDLIVVGVHGRNPFDMMVFGSTTNQVVRRAACPVLTLRR
ncbi:MAG TPA: universal stress protein, partial [Gemmatimonadaceae bacterium]